MNIGINARFLLPGIKEGISRYTWEIVKRMVIKHPDNHYYLYFDRPFDNQYVIADNITPVVVYPPARHPVLFYIWYEFALARRMKKDGIDVFFSPDNFCSLCTQIPTVLVVHDLAYLHFPKHLPMAARWYYQYFMPKFVAKAKRIIAVSDYTKQDIVKQYSMHTSKVDVATNALPDRVRQRGSTSAKNYALYVGSLHPRKNIRNMLFAYQKVYNSVKIPLYIIGRDAGMESSTLSMLNNMIANGSVIWKANVTDAELHRYYQSAKVFVYVSLFEGFGIPILEAMSEKVPVITSNVSSMPEVSGGAAILVDPKDTAAIANAIVQVLSDEELSADLIAKGLINVSKFSWDTSADVVYDSILKVHGQ